MLRFRTLWTGLLVMAALLGGDLRAESGEPEIVVVARADDKHVRNSEGAALELKDGRLLLIWTEFEKGKGDSDFFPARLVAKTSRDAGRTWDDYRVIVENLPGDVNVFSPNLIRRDDGAILFVFMRYHSFAKKQDRPYPPSSIYAWISTDEAKTFTPLAVVSSERFTTSSSSCIRRLSTGRIVLPLNIDTGKKKERDHWQASVAYSDDGGKTWKESDNLVDAPKRGAMEPHVEELRDGRLLMVLRTQMGSIYMAESADCGKNWSKSGPLGVESPESCPELLKIPKTGDLLLIWNAARYDPKWASHSGKRTPLSAAISKDDGKTWSKPRHIETNAGWAFSNPGAYFTSKGALFLNYWACRYKPNGYMENFPIDLKAALVDVAWLYGNEPAAGKPGHALDAHRTLFNGDCTFLFGDAFVQDIRAKYTKDTLHRFIHLLADNGVDTFLCNPNAQVPWYPSKRTPSILNGYRRGDRDFFRGQFRAGLPKERLDPALDDQVLFLNRYLDLAEAGVNWVDEITQACRRRHVSPWVSIRMNDMHGANSWEKSYMNCALQRDPRYRLSGKQANPKDPNNRMEQSLNYGKKEVRDYMLLVIRELLEDHDFEGLELDWLRCPYCIDPPASSEAIDIVTNWHAEVRALCQEKARRSGKPCPLGLRIPIRLGQLKAIGIDVPAMVEKGLVDFVNLSNFWQTSWDVPYEHLRAELGTNVAIYGVIEDAPNWMNALDPKTGKKGYRLLTASPELLRGNAAGKLVLGVHGIEFFNFFCTDEKDHNPLYKEGQARYPAIKKLSDLEALRGKPKQYTLSTAQGAFVFPMWEYAEQLPALVEPEAKKAFRLSMCREPDHADLDLVIQVVSERTETVPDLGVSVNGNYPSYSSQETDRLVFPTGIYTNHVPEHRALEFHFKASAIKEGWNEVLVFNGSHKNKAPTDRRDNAARIVGLELAVRAPARP